MSDFFTDKTIAHTDIKIKRIKTGGYTSGTRCALTLVLNKFEITKVWSTKMKKSLLTALALLISSQAALASKIVISDWEYINEAGFGAYSTDWAGDDQKRGWGGDTPFNGSSSNGFTSILSSGELNDHICWGSDTNTTTEPSCLDFLDENDLDSSRLAGNVQTSSPHGELLFADGTSIRHTNLGINSPLLTSINILDALQLDNIALLSPFMAPEIDFSVFFNESKNDCSLIEIQPWCPDDVFVITASDGVEIINIDVANKFIDVAVMMDLTGLVGPGYHTDYQIITRLSGLEPIPGLPFGAFGLVTLENTVNYLRAQFAVRAVPEPSILAIFGLLTILVGFSAKRKKA